MYLNSRILSIMAMLDSGIDEFLDDYIENTEKYYRKMMVKSDYNELTIRLIKELNDVFPDERIKTAQKYLAKYRELSENPYNIRSFVYLDLISWLEAMVEHVNIAEVIQRKSV